MYLGESIDVMAILKKSGGCAGGVSIYGGAKALMWAANTQRIRRTLWSNTQALMKTYFPKIDFGDVEFCINCTLVSNWFASPGSVSAMTFGNTIFFKGSDIQKNRAGLKLLMHELFHVNQVRELGGQIEFACEYGKGYLAKGSYRDNPMEAKAYQFVADHGNELPLEQTKPQGPVHLHGQPQCAGGNHHGHCPRMREETSCGRVMNFGFICHHKS